MVPCCPWITSKLYNMAPAYLSSFIYFRSSITGNSKPLLVLLILPEEVFGSFFHFCLPWAGRVLYFHPFYLVTSSLFFLTLYRKPYTPNSPALGVPPLCFQNILGISHYKAGLFLNHLFRLVFTSLMESAAHTHFSA